MTAKYREGCNLEVRKSKEVSRGGRMSKGERAKALVRSTEGSQATEEHMQWGKAFFHSEIGSRLRISSRNLASLVVLQNHPSCCAEK